MRKRIRSVESPKRVAKAKGDQEPLTIGIDLGDKHSRYCVLRSDGRVVKEDRVETRPKALKEVFGKMGRARMAIEVGTHSPWVSRVLEELGHEVIVANPREVKLITKSSRKSDRVDAQTLARLARVDPELLRPIRHRGEKAQLDLMKIRVRATLVEQRTAAVNALRGFAKSVGERLPGCDADQMGAEQLAGLPAVLRSTLQPLAEQVEALTGQIEELNRELEQIAGKDYPETALLRQVHGVGVLIALTFVLTIEDKGRFARSRDVGCYLGMRPRRGDSGESQPQMRITKEGDPYLRKLLVQGAHGTMSYGAPDSDLKRWGKALAARGGKRGKKIAVVAVARKLGILLHRLWVTGEVYEPLRNARLTTAA